MESNVKHKSLGDKILEDGSTISRGCFYITLDKANCIRAELQYHWVDHNRIQANKISVPPAYKGKGIATALADALFSYCQQESIFVIPKCPFIREHYAKSCSESVRTLILPYSLESEAFSPVSPQSGVSLSPPSVTYETSPYFTGVVLDKYLCTTAVSTSSSDLDSATISFFPEVMLLPWHPISYDYWKKFLIFADTPIYNRDMLKTALLTLHGPSNIDVGLEAYLSTLSVEEEEEFFNIQLPTMLKLAKETPEAIMSDCNWGDPTVLPIMPSITENISKCSETNDDIKTSTITNTGKMQTMPANPVQPSEDVPYSESLLYREPLLAINTLPMDKGVESVIQGIELTAQQIKENAVDLQKKLSASVLDRKVALEAGVSGVSVLVSPDDGVNTGMSTGKGMAVDQSEDVCDSVACLSQGVGSLVLQQKTAQMSARATSGIQARSTDMNDNSSQKETIPEKYVSGAPGGKNAFLEKELVRGTAFTAPRTGFFVDPMQNFPSSSASSSSVSCPPPSSSLLSLSRRSCAGLLAVSVFGDPYTGSESSAHAKWMKHKYGKCITKNDFYYRTYGEFMDKNQKNGNDDEGNGKSTSGAFFTGRKQHIKDHKKMNHTRDGAMADDNEKKINVSEKALFTYGCVSSVYVYMKSNAVRNKFRCIMQYFSQLHKERPSGILGRLEFRRSNFRMDTIAVTQALASDILSISPKDVFSGNPSSSGNQDVSKIRKIRDVSLRAFSHAQALIRHSRLQASTNAASHTTFTSSHTCSSASSSSSSSVSTPNTTSVSHIRNSLSTPPPSLRSRAYYVYSTEAHKTLSFVLSTSRAPVLGAVVGVNGKIPVKNPKLKNSGKTDGNFVNISYLNTVAMYHYDTQQHIQSGVYTNSENSEKSLKTPIPENFSHLLTAPTPDIPAGGMDDDDIDVICPVVSLNTDDSQKNSASSSSVAPSSSNLPHSFPSLELAANALSEFPTFPSQNSIKPLPTAFSGLAFLQTPSHCPTRIPLEDDPSHTPICDFANKYIGGGVLSQGCVQEEILFSIFPECLVSLMFSPVMSREEAIAIVGALRVANYTGYGSGFTYAGARCGCRDKGSDGDSNGGAEEWHERGCAMYGERWGAGWNIGYGYGHEGMNEYNTNNTISDTTDTTDIIVNTALASHASTASATAHAHMVDYNKGNIESSIVAVDALCYFKPKLQWSELAVWREMVKFAAGMCIPTGKSWKIPGSLSKNLVSGNFCDIPAPLVPPSMQSRVALNNGISHDTENHSHTMNLVDKTGKSPDLSETLPFSRLSATEGWFATGNWGCGVFNGDHELKCVIQLLICSIYGKCMKYFALDSPNLTQLPLFLGVSYVNSLKIHELYTMLRMYLRTFAKYNFAGYEMDEVLAASFRDDIDAFNVYAPDTREEKEILRDTLTSWSVHARNMINNTQKQTQMALGEVFTTISDFSTCTPTQSTVASVTTTTSSEASSFSVDNTISNASIVSHSVSTPHSVPTPLSSPPLHNKIPRYDSPVKDSPLVSLPHTTTSPNLDTMNTTPDTAAIASEKYSVNTGNSAAGPTSASPTSTAAGAVVRSSEEKKRPSADISVSSTTGTGIDTGEIKSTGAAPGTGAAKSATTGSGKIGSGTGKTASSANGAGILKYFTKVSKPLAMATNTNTSTATMGSGSGSSAYEDMAAHTSPSSSSPPLPTSIPVTVTTSTQSSSIHASTSSSSFPSTSSSHAQVNATKEGENKTKSSFSIFSCIKSNTNDTKAFQKCDTILKIQDLLPPIVNFETTQSGRKGKPILEGLFAYVLRMIKHIRGPHYVEFEL